MNTLRRKSYIFLFTLWILLANTPIVLAVNKWPSANIRWDAHGNFQLESRHLCFWWVCMCMGVWGKRVIFTKHETGKREHTKIDTWFRSIVHLLGVYTTLNFCRISWRMKALRCKLDNAMVDMLYGGILTCNMRSHCFCACSTKSKTTKDTQRETEGGGRGWWVRESPQRRRKIFASTWESASGFDTADSCRFLPFFESCEYAVDIC